MKPLIVIPARIGSTRLKNKPLREINGIPLITHVCLRALEADIGLVIVSSDDERVLQSVPPSVGIQWAKGIEEHCGSDRVAYAAETFSSDHDYIINLQGDLPFIDPQILRDLWDLRRIVPTDIVTAYTIFSGVQAFGGEDEDNFYRHYVNLHIGLYAYTAESLVRFAKLPQDERERVEKLEQLRASENGMTFDWLKVDHMPLEINTESDLKHANLIAEALWRSEDVRPRYRGASGGTFPDGTPN